MEYKQRVTPYLVVFASFLLGLIAVGQNSDGGLKGILTPYLDAILAIILIILPIEVILRIVFKASLLDMVR